MCHVVLCGFQREERRGKLWVLESSGFCGNRPEQVTHASGKAANGGGCDFTACAPLGTVQQVEVWLLQRPLWREHEDRVGGDALIKQVAHPFHACGCFPRSSFAVNEELNVKGRFDCLLLNQTEAGCERIHVARVQECSRFVNYL